MIDSTDNSSGSVDNTIYFADREYESPDFAGEVFSFAQAWVTWCENAGLANRWTQNECLYHGVDPNSLDRETGVWDEDAFNVIGKNGELLCANYNDARNLMQHILTMTCAQPPGIHAKAINDDDASLVAAQTFDGVFSYYLTTHRSGRLLKQSRIAVERSLLDDTGYMLVEWDTSLGNPIGIKTEPVETTHPITGELTQTQQPVTDERGQTQLEFEGDLYFKARSPWDVFFDAACEDEDEADWVLVRDQVNKFEYAKLFPKHKEEILSAGMMAVDRLNSWRRGAMKPTKTNLINVWKFYHRPTAGMPKGRYAILLNAKTVLKDGVNPYDRLPLFSVKAMEGLGSLVGYGPMNVEAPIQQSRNILSSAMMTNFAMFGVQNVAVKDSDQFDVAEIAGSMNVLRYADAPPQALQLAAQANGIEDHYDRLGHLGETLVGVTSVQRGDPEASLKSGKALGIVQAAGVQYNSALAASYAQFLKDIGNFMLYCFRSFLQSERVTHIVGENDRMQSLTWDRDTFGPIDRVEAELVDPAMRTLGYRTDLAMFLAQNNMTTTTQEFLTVLTTGQLKPMYRAQLNELNCIHQENSEMMRGIREGQQQFDALQQQTQMLMQVNPLAAQQLGMQMQQLISSIVPPVREEDNDELHMAEHAAIASAPATRRNAFAMAINDAHRQAHEANMQKKALKKAQMAVQLQAGTQQMAIQSGAMQQQAPAPQQAQPQHAA